MKLNDHDTSVYLLIDNGLLHEVSASYTETDLSCRPKWMSPIYPERALAVSPLLIDLEGAYDGGDLDQVMHYLHALQPALHVSIIETALDLEDLAKHLRRFIFVVDPNGKQFTFRYADCSVLALVPAILTEAQWAYMSRPIERWSIHDRSGAIGQLASIGFFSDEPVPFQLSSDQLANLDEATEPDHYIAKVKLMLNGEPLPGTPAEQNAWAQAARQFWRASNNKKSLALMFLTEAALKTRGKILHREKTKNLLSINEVDAFRAGLDYLSKEIQE